VLEVGTGSGYLTACLAELAGQVHSIDVFPEFVEQAQYRLQQLQLKNVTIECLDATKALPSGSFDAIAVSSSLPVPLPGLLDLLATGGRMFVVTGETPVMSAQLIQHGVDGSWQTDNMFETWLKPMINVAQPPAFSF
jgi:protein-L-isoaspartate(D-aspartate) O-methyltransferase